MKIDSKFLEDHQTELTVEIDSETMESAKRRAAKKIAKRVKIPGFRPGKAPYPVIVRQVGEPRVVEEALEIVIEDVYPDIIEEAEISPYGPGSLEEVIDLDPPIFKFKIPLDPEVSLGDYRSLRRPYEQVKISDQDVDEVIESLRQRQAVIEPVDRPAQQGDEVTVLLSAKSLKGAETTDTDLIQERSYPIIIQFDDSESEEENSPKNDEWPFNGFSQNFVGLNEGKNITINHKYPDDLQDETFSGKEVEFSAVIENVKSRTLPELDDEFANSTGGYENIDTMRAEIRKNLQNQAEISYNESYDTNILEEAVNQAEFKYPPQAIDDELERVISNLKSRLEQTNIDFDLYLKTRQIDMDGLREESLPVAEERLKQKLFLMELSKAEDVQVDTNEVQSEAQVTIDFLTRSLSRTEARKLENERVYKAVIGNVMADMISRAAMDVLRDIFKGQYQDKTDEDEQLIEEDKPNSELEENGDSSIEKEEAVFQMEESLNNEIADNIKLLENEENPNEEILEDE